MVNMIVCIPNPLQKYTKFLRYANKKGKKSNCRTFEGTDTASRPTSNLRSHYRANTNFLGLNYIKMQAF